MGGRVEEDRLEERGRPVEGGDKHGSSNLGVNRTEPRREEPERGYREMGRGITPGNSQFHRGGGADREDLGSLGGGGGST